MVDKLSRDLRGKDMTESPGSHTVIPEISYCVKCIWRLALLPWWCSHWGPYFSSILSNNTAKHQVHHLSALKPKIWSMRPSPQQQKKTKPAKVTEDCQTFWHLHWSTLKTAQRKPCFSDNHNNSTAEPLAKCRVSTNISKEPKQQGSQTAQ